MLLFSSINSHSVCLLIDEFISSAAIFRCILSETSLSFTLLTTNEFSEMIDSVFSPYATGS